MGKELVGKVAHYFSKIGVAVIELEKGLKVGDKISIEGAHDAVEQTVNSMQVEHQNISEAKPGQAIGMKVNGVVHQNSKVFRVTPD